MFATNKRKLKGGTKQKKTTTRLMAISILVDRHIYKNELISSKQAKEFLDEVTKLKLICEGDERSLQVIDKLQTYMKLIINEQSPCDTNITKNNNNTSNLTPVQNNDNSKESPDTELQIKCTDYIKSSCVNNINIVEKTQSNPVLLEPVAFEETHIALGECNNDSITRQNLKSSENLKNNLQDASCNDLHVQELTESNTPNIQNQNTPSAKDNINVKFIKSTNKRRRRSKSKNKSRTDLSWVENIRFVREVCADEHTHAEIQDSFWTDLSIPDTCDFDDK